MTITVKNTLIRPLLLHGTIGLEPTHPWTKAVKTLQQNKKKKKAQNTDDLEAQILQLQYCMASYWDAKKKRFYVPSESIERSLRDAAALQRLGKKSEAAFQVIEAMCPFECKEYPEMPEDYEPVITYPDDLNVVLDRALVHIYDLNVGIDDGFVFKKPVRIPPRTGNMVPYHRPMIPVGSTFTFTLQVDTGLVSEVNARKCCADMAYQIGVGAWRPKFGRFTVEFLD